MCTRVTKPTCMHIQAFIYIYIYIFIYICMQKYVCIDEHICDNYKVQRSCERHVAAQSGNRAPSQYPKRRLFVRSRKVSKPRDWYFKLSYRFEIWQAHRQHCCRSACQISERSDNSKYKLAASTLYEILRKDVFSAILRRGPDLVI